MLDGDEAIFSKNSISGIVRDDPYLLLLDAHHHFDPMLYHLNPIHPFRDFVEFVRNYFHWNALLDHHLYPSCPHDHHNLEFEFPFGTPPKIQARRSTLYLYEKHCMFMKNNVHCDKKSTSWKMITLVYFLMGGIPYEDTL